MICLITYDEIQDGAVSLDAEQQKDLDDLYDELTDGEEQLNSGKYSRLVIASECIAGERGNLCFFGQGKTNGAQLLWG